MQRIAVRAKAAVLGGLDVKARIKVKCPAPTIEERTQPLIIPRYQIDAIALHRLDTDQSAHGNTFGCLGLTPDYGCLPGPLLCAAAISRSEIVDAAGARGDPHDQLAFHHDLKKIATLRPMTQLIKAGCLGKIVRRQRLRR